MYPRGIACINYFGKQKVMLACMVPCVVSACEVLQHSVKSVQDYKQKKHPGQWRHRDMFYRTKL